MDYPHCSAALEYCEQVTQGIIPACKWTKLACQRHLDDLARDDWDYWFDPAAGERACMFLEMMPHVKGRRWAGQTITLEPWQSFMTVAIFGWKNAEGVRRFKTAYICVPRKNAKSTWLAGISLYALSMDDELGAEVYSAATTREQARVVFDVAQQMGRKSAEYRHRYGVEVHAHSISQTGSGSLMRPLSADAGSLDGLNIHLAAIDELHAHKTRSVWDVLDSATGSREQPLIIAITTAGSNLSGICYEQHLYVQKVLQNITKDESYFGLIYGIDEGDDEFDPQTWAKANPNLGVSVMVEDLERMAIKAKETPAARNNFRTKRLNVWVNAMEAAVPMEKWQACAKPLRMEAFKGEECIIAVDLASKIDVAAVSLEFNKGGTPYRFHRYYLPQDTIENAKNSQYHGWAEAGYIRKTPGARIDYDIIRDDILQFCEDFDVLEVVFDPWQAAHIMNELEEREVTTLILPNTVQNFSEPMKEIIAEIVAEQCVYNANPVTEWMYSNVIGRYDAKNNIYPRKENEESKIDGFVADVMAKNRWLWRQESEGPSVYEDEGLFVI